jgi:hypothetical protein
MAHDNYFSDPVQTWDARFGAPDFLFGTEPKEQGL